MKSVRLLIPAREEMYEAAAYYESCSEGLGRDFTFSMETAIRDIRENPERWPVINGGDVRRYLLYRFPFCLLYRIDPAETVILAVMHTRRNPKYWLRRKTL